jgi:hypothetical protein
VAAESLNVEQEIFREAAARAEDDPAWFYNKVLNFPAQPWQIIATEAVFDVRRKTRGQPTKVNHKGLPRISIRSCHGPGKTQFLGMLAHIWGFTTYGKIAATAPKEAQLLKRLWPRYRKAMRNADSVYKSCVQVLGREVILFKDPDWGMVAETASDPDNLSGYHDEPQLFLIDEASARRLDSMFPVIEGALTTLGSVSVEIGNPTRLEGEFYNHHCKRGISELYFLMHIKPEDSEYITQEWVDTMVKKYGKDSAITAIRAFGEFASFDEYLLFQPDLIEEMFDIDEVSDGSISRLRVTVDVADGGADATVITAMRHYDTFKQLLKQKAFYFDPGKAPILAARAAKEMFEGFGGNVENGDDVVVDGLGVGAGTVGKAIELGLPVIRYIGGAASDDPTRWRNRRVQSYMAYYDDVKEGRVHITEGAIDDEEEFRAHMLSIKRNVANERIDDLETKDKIKQAGQPSPDRSDSGAMQYSTEVPMYEGNSQEDVVVFGGYMATGVSM